jgi:hypothetical protein
MYLIDTNVISEARKRAKANRGVRAFFQRVSRERSPVFISVITVGELRRGIELIRHRRDRLLHPQRGTAAGAVGPGERHGGAQCGVGAAECHRGTGAAGDREDLGGQRPAVPLGTEQLVRAHREPGELKPADQATADAGGGPPGQLPDAPAWVDRQSQQKGRQGIVRTAGALRQEEELQRDMEYLLRLWKSIVKRVESTTEPGPARSA